MSRQDRCWIFLLYVDGEIKGLAAPQLVMEPAPAQGSQFPCLSYSQLYPTSQSGLLSTSFPDLAPFQAWYTKKTTPILTSRGLPATLLLAGMFWVVA